MAKAVATMLALAMLAACAAAPPPVAFSGTLTTFERVAIPPDARVQVELRDAADDAAPVLASQSVPATGGPPYDFALALPPGRIAPDAALALSAAIEAGDRLMFTASQPVPRTGAADQAVELTFVASAPGDPAPGVITPIPTAYRCGTEDFQVAFEAGRAYVTLPDRSLMLLERLDPDGDPEAPRRYGNGRLTFVQGTEGAAGPRVRFARGRMVPTPCQALDAAASGPEPGADPLLAACGTVAAEGYCGVVFGMTPQAASAAFPLPLAGYDGLDLANPPSCYLLFPDGRPDDLAFMVVDGQVARVDVMQPGLATAEGASVGMSEAELLARYPAAEVRPNKYDPGARDVVVAVAPDRQLVFETDGAAVIAYRAGVLPAVGFVERCG